MSFLSKLFRKPSQTAEFFPFHLYNVMHPKGCGCYKCLGNPDGFGYMPLSLECRKCLLKEPDNCEHCSINKSKNKKELCSLCERESYNLECETCPTKLKAIREYQLRAKINIEEPPLVS